MDPVAKNYGVGSGCRTSLFSGPHLPAGRPRQLRRSAETQGPMAAQPARPAFNTGRQKTKVLSLACPPIQADSTKYTYRLLLGRQFKKSTLLHFLASCISHKEPAGLGMNKCFVIY